MSLNSFEFKALASTGLSYGNQKPSEAEQEKERTIYGYGIDVNLALNYDYYLIGYGFDYSDISQIDSASKFNGTNASGILNARYISLGVGNAKYGLIYKSYISPSTYDYKRKNNTDSSVTAFSPSNSFALEALKRWSNYSYISLNYKSIKLNKSIVDGSSQNRGNNDDMSLSALSLNYGFHY